MCEKCKEIDVQVARCERLSGYVTDKLFVDGLAELVKGYRENRLASCRGVISRHS